MVKKSTIRQLQGELRRLRSRVEDLRGLKAAIERNAGKPGIPWGRAKKEMGL